MTENGKKFEVLEQKTEYEGFFHLERYRLRHTLYRGGWSKVLDRELFERGNCVAVLLYDPFRDEVVLLQQFRVGAIKSEKGAWLLEIVAGAVEEGESPDDVARREAQEEAGCEILELVRIGEFYTSPGAASEKIALYCGRVNCMGVGGVHGLRHEGEDILVSAVPAAEAIGKVETGEIESAIPVIALQWLALNKERLRRDFGAV